MYLSMYVCLYPSSAHSLKLGKANDNQYEMGDAAKGTGKNFFCISMRFRSFLSRLRRTFFSKIFVSAKRETRAKRETCTSEMQAQSAKPEGAKLPSSPAGLAGRSA